MTLKKRMKITQTCREVQVAYVVFVLGVAGFMQKYCISHKKIPCTPSKSKYSLTPQHIHPSVRQLIYCQSYSYSFGSFLPVS
jgi:hypothetical protein